MSDNQHRIASEHVVSRSQKFLSFVSEKASLLGVLLIIVGALWGLHVLYMSGSFSFSDSSSETSGADTTTRTIVATPEGTSVSFSCPYQYKWENGRVRIFDRDGRLIHNGSGHVDHGRSPDFSKLTFYGDNIPVTITEEASC